MSNGHRPLAPSKVRVPAVAGLTRERVLLALDRVWQHRLGLVLAPPGAGKTTALAQYANSVESPVAWYRAEPTDGRADVLIAYLVEALTAALQQPVGDPSDIEGLVAELENFSGPPVLLVVDDLHMLEGTAAERELERLLELAPPFLHVLAGSRRAPAFNLPRLRVSGNLLEVDASDLRFRSWEVEQLFRSVYGEPLPPEELATLSRRTEGWAAGLQLFHLATAGKPVEERREAVASLSIRSRLVRGYLTHNVLSDMPEELREFLIGTSVLGRLTASLCDRLRNSTGSQGLLEEIERRQFFLIPLDDEDAYRMHEVLRSHLEAILIDQIGAEAALERYGKAAVLLEEAGALPEALHAYCRAGQWEDAARLLGDSGDQLGADPGGWLETLPPALAEHDPWLVLARARRAAADGRLALAISAFRQAEETFGSTAPAEVCRRERQVMALWADASPVPTTHWSGPLRAAVRRDPLAALQQLPDSPDATGALVAGLARLLYGQLPESRSDLDNVAAHPGVGISTQAAARLGAAASLLLEGGTPDTPPLQQLARRVEDRGLSWLARQARAVAAAAAAPPQVAELAAIRATCQGCEDTWGAALVGLLLAVAQLRSGADPRACAESSAAEFRRLGAGVLEAIALALGAAGAARNGGESAGGAVAQARSAGRATGSRWAQLLAALAAGADSDALALAADCGVSPDAVRSALLTGGPPRPTDVSRPALRCLGTFALETPAGEVSLSGLKPRCQELLRLLAVRGGRPVHRDELVAALWPEAEATAGAHNLHTAVSTLRRFLEHTVGQGLVIREGLSYRLAAPEQVDVDVITFKAAAAAARVAIDAGGRRSALPQAVAAYSGELLAGEVTVEWVVRDRDALRAEAVDVTVALAQTLLAAGLPREAAQACQAGLRIDRYRDELWRLLIDAFGRADDPAAGARARRQYDDVLAELGLVPATGSHEVAIDNRGNQAVEVALSGSDPNDELSFRFAAPSVLAAPGTASFNRFRVSSRGLLWRGQPATIPFAVTVTPYGQPPIRLDASFQQQPMIPAWLPRTIAAVIALTLFAAIAWRVVLKPTVERAVAQAPAVLENKAAIDSVAAQTGATIPSPGATGTPSPVAGNTTTPGGTPLGSPVAVPVSITTNAGNTDTVRVAFPPQSKTVLSISSIVAQNAFNDAGVITASRRPAGAQDSSTDEVLLRQSLFGQPSPGITLTPALNLAAGDTILLSLQCVKPGAVDTGDPNAPGNPNQQCNVSVLISGFARGDGKTPAATPSPSPL